MPDNKYISASIENGSIFDTLVGNLLALRLEDWGWSEQDYDKISIEFSVASNDLFFLPIGNYRMLNFPISLLPNDLGITAIESVNLKVYVKDDSGTKYYILDVNNKSYLMSLTGSGLTPSWKDLENVGSDGEDMTLIHVGETAPENTNMIWIDTSKLITEDLITMKVYNTASGTWKEYTITGVMDSSIYDPTGKKQDPFKYVMNAIEVIIGDYAEFIKHKNNELVLIHVTSEEKEYYNTVIISIDVINEMLQSGGDIYNSLIELITTNTAETVGTEEFKNQIEELKRLFNEHIGETHISESDVLSWDSKAPADHTHEYDPNVIINAEDISGDLSTLLGDTSEAKERVKIVTSDAERFALTKPEIHNGCSVCVDDGVNEPVWYKVIDDTKLNIEDGYKKFATTVTKTTFDTITNPPNTLEGYGITDGVSKDELKEIENKIDNEIENITFVPTGYNKESVGESELYVGIQKTLGDGGGTSNYPMSFSKSLLDILVYKDGNLNVDKFANTKEYYLLNNFLFKKTFGNSINGVNCIATNDKFIIIDPIVDLSITDFNILYSTDGVVWETHKDEKIASTFNSPNNSLLYMNKNTISFNGEIFVYVFTDTNVFLYSMDGINWQKSESILTSSIWTGVVWGGNKFIAISSSNKYAYSVDGINWTEQQFSTSVVSADSLKSITYGDNKYVMSILEQKSQQEKPFNLYFIISNDGINWNRNIESMDNAIMTKTMYNVINYENGKFITLPTLGTAPGSVGEGIPEELLLKPLISNDGYIWNEIQTDFYIVEASTPIIWNGVRYIGIGGIIGARDDFRGFGVYYSYDSEKWYTEIIDILNIFIGSTETTLPFNILSKNGQIVLSAKDAIYSTEYDLQIPDSVSGFSKFPSDNVKDDYFTSLYSSDDQNPKFTSDGLGVMIKVDTSQNNIVYQNTYNIAEKNINILIGWDMLKGLYFKHDIVEGINNINSIYDVLMNNGDPLNNWLNNKYSDLLRVIGKIIWKETSNGLSSRNWFSICYGNGKYVAVATGSNIFAYSTDGITWTETNNGLSNARYWFSICYGNGKYMAAASDSNTFAYSTDGITWTETSNGLNTRQWRSICYGNGKYIAVAYIFNAFAYLDDFYKSKIDSNSKLYLNNIQHSNLQDYRIYTTAFGEMLTDDIYKENTPPPQDKRGS